MEFLLYIQQVALQEMVVSYFFLSLAIVIKWIVSGLYWEKIIYYSKNDYNWKDKNSKKMKVSTFIVGLLFLVVGLTSYYIIYAPKVIFFILNGKSFLLMLSEIFIMLGWLSILSFCFDIDGSNIL